MKKNRMNENGVTLVELLAYTILASIITLFVYSFLTNSINTQKKIMIETTVRDEADLIMSNLVKHFFTLKESHVRKVEFDAANKLYLIHTSEDVNACTSPPTNPNCQKTGFTSTLVNNKPQMELLINNEKYIISNPSISLHSDSKMIVSSSTNKKVTYQIYLALAYDNQKFSNTYYFENQVQSIQDTQK